MSREFIRRDTFATISNRNECNVTVMTAVRSSKVDRIRGHEDDRRPRVQDVFFDGNCVLVLHYRATRSRVG